MADSPGMERVVGRVLDSRLLDTSIARLLASDELWSMVEEIAQSPVVSDAITHQGLSFADEMAGEVRTRSRRIDDRLAHAARRALRGTLRAGRISRRRRPGLSRSLAAPATPLYTGLVTRAIALAIDGLLINGIAVLVGRVVALALSVLHDRRTTAVLAAISGVVYLLWSAAYFVSFWSTTGQTPGGHVMRFGVREARPARHQRPPGDRTPRRAGHSAAMPLCAGFVPMLFDSRLARAPGLDGTDRRDRHWARRRPRPMCTRGRRRRDAVGEPALSPVPGRCEPRAPDP